MSVSRKRQVLATGDVVLSADEQADGLRSVPDLSQQNSHEPFLKEIAGNFPDVRTITPVVAEALVRAVLTRSRLLPASAPRAEAMVKEIVRLFFEHAETRARLNQFWCEVRACSESSDAGQA